jgi:uncharacterized membrane protein YoaK (UPF0700 family)
MAAPILPRCPLRPLLLLQTALLIGFLGLGVGLGRFPDTNSSMAVLGGMLGVAAMATQDALVKLALKEAPSTAVMTTNIAQLTVDLARLARSRRNPDEFAQAGHRACMTLPCIIGFVVGCAAGAALDVKFGRRALVLPVALAVIAIPLGETQE